MYYENVTIASLYHRYLSSPFLITFSSLYTPTLIHEHPLASRHQIFVCSAEGKLKYCLEASCCQAMAASRCWDRRGHYNNNWLLRCPRIRRIPSYLTHPMDSHSKLCLMKAYWFYLNIAMILQNNELSKFGRRLRLSDAGVGWIWVKSAVIFGEG